MGDVIKEVGQTNIFIVVNNTVMSDRPLSVVISAPTAHENECLETRSPDISAPTAHNEKTNSTDDEFSDDEIDCMSAENSSSSATSVCKFSMRWVMT